jgi:dihydrodipicolinate synthase/N-acetylneuraminate lyase
MSVGAGLTPDKSAALARGGVIPAHPLALDEQRTLDERRQRALTRYYLEAGVHGIAIGVHTTQFAIRDPKIGLFRPVLELAQGIVAESAGTRPITITIAGVMGPTAQAMGEAQLAADLGYDLIMPHLGALKDADDDELVAHCSRLAEIRPVFGFYLQPAVGGRPLSYRFWRRFAEIQNVRAIKIAPFDRYATLDVVRAVADSGRTDVALYTGNDDHIALDLLTPFRFGRGGSVTTLRIVGGLLGHWAVWTRAAVDWFATITAATGSGEAIDGSLLVLANEVTDCNSALFDVSHGFLGSIAGIHEVLRRQGLLSGRWCLDPKEDLSPGQSADIDRVYSAYPHLTDDEFVRANRDRWLS